MKSEISTYQLWLDYHITGGVSRPRTKHAVRLHYKHSNDWGWGGCCECNATNTYQKILIDLHKAKEVPQLTNGDNVAYLTIGIALGVELVTRI